MFQWCRAGTSCAKNQRCTGVSGAVPVTSPCSARTAAAVPAARARAATVRCSNTCRGVSSSPARRARETIWMERMESPPAVKKSSRMPTRSTPSTSAHTRARAASAGVRGASYSVSPAAAPASAAGRARRSTLPLPVRGMASSSTKRAGAMYSGRRRARWARRTEAGAPPSGPAGTR